MTLFTAATVNAGEEPQIGLVRVVVPRVADHERGHDVAHPDDHGADAVFVVDALGGSDSHGCY